MWGSTWFETRKGFRRFKPYELGRGHRGTYFSSTKPVSLHDQERPCWRRIWQGRLFAMTRSIDLLERELEKAAAELKTLKSEMALAGNRDKCRDALVGLRKAAERVQEEVHELLVDLNEMTWNEKP